MTEFVYGINPVRELLLAKKRKCHSILISERKNKSETDDIVKLAKKNNVSIQKTNNHDLAKLTGTSHHQGIVANADSYKYLSEDEINGNFIVIADGVQDPQNLGALIRSSYLFGVDCLIIPERGSAGVTATVAKASAGAVEHFNISKVVNITRFIKNIQEKGYWVVGLEADTGVSICNHKFSDKIVLVVGGEGHGIRRLVRETCDELISIPMEKDFVGSLNASVSGALAIFEVYKQKKCQ